MIKTNFKLTLSISTIALIYAFVGYFINEFIHDLNLRWLYWNLLLAIIPMIIAFITYSYVYYFNKWDIIPLILSFVWLLFLPNACYMLTDLIHLESSTIISSNGTYLMDLSAWIELLFISSGIILALVFGLFSTSLIQSCINIKFKLINSFFGIIISALVGYGVYIGRFLRFNTWDLLHPRSLYQSLITNLDKFAIAFTIMIAIIYFFSYLIFNHVYTSELSKKTKQ